jgi:hypothetical protein
MEKTTATTSPFHSLPMQPSGLRTEAQGLNDQHATGVRLVLEMRKQRRQANSHPLTLDLLVSECLLNDRAGYLEALP